MYDELDRLQHTFAEWVKGAEESILRGESIKDFQDYKVRVAQLKCYQRAAHEIETVRTKLLQEET